MQGFEEGLDQTGERQTKIIERLKAIENDLDFFKLVSKKNVGDTATLLQNMQEFRQNVLKQEIEKKAA